MNLCRYLMTGTGCVHAKASRTFKGPESCVDCKWYAGSHRGLGDVVASVVSAVGVDRIVGAVEHLAKKDCGCGQRRAAMNAAFPFSDKTSDVPSSDNPVEPSAHATLGDDAERNRTGSVAPKRNDVSEARIGHPDDDGSSAVHRA